MFDLSFLRIFFLETGKVNIKFCVGCLYETYGIGESRVAGEMMRFKITSMGEKNNDFRRHPLCFHVGTGNISKIFFCLSK